MGWFGKLTETEQRKRKARLLYDFEVECRGQGWGIPPSSSLLPLPPLLG
jgi:hypothetical protein